MRAGKKSALRRDADRLFTPVAVDHFSTWEFVLATFADVWIDLISVALLDVVEGYLGRELHADLLRTNLLRHSVQHFEQETRAVSIGPLYSSGAHSDFRDGSVVICNGALPPGLSSSDRSCQGVS